MITKKELAKWREIESKASDKYRDPGDLYHDCAVGTDLSEEDTDFIAHARNTYRRLLDEVERLRAVLEKIADPRKRDHTEPDEYTQLGCVMNMANEALESK